jgi:glycosyltransferase involved in cell wall biosynthesis
MEKRRILFICNKSPWPEKEGGSIAMNRLIEGLADAGNKVKVLAVNSEKYHVNPEDIPADYRSKTGIELVPVDLTVKLFPAFFNLFSQESYHVRRFISLAFRKKLIEILQKETFDVVQMETLFMAPYIDTVHRYSRAKIVLRAHNIEHLIWKRMAGATRNPLKKLYLRHLFTTLEKYEKQVLDHFDAILPITEKDALFFRTYCHKPVKTIPFGIDLRNYSPATTPAEHALFHIGAMNWMPNEEGISWFLKEVWPALLQKYPGIKLYLAGRAMPAWLKNLEQKNVTIVGEVPDARRFILSKSIAIAPLFSGSGVRIKIIESMALGKAVISTTLGAEGISCTHGKDIVLADTAGAFADAVGELFAHPEKAAELGKNARKLIETQHDNRKIIDELERFYAEIL